MSNIRDIISLVDKSQARIELNPQQARCGFELAERELDQLLLTYHTTRYEFKNDIVKLYLPLYQQIMDGYHIINKKGGQV